MIEQVHLPGIEAQRGDVSSDACFTPLPLVLGVAAALGGNIHTDRAWHPDCHVPDGPIRFDGRGRGDGLNPDNRTEVNQFMNCPYSAPAPWAAQFAMDCARGIPSIALMRLDPTTAAWADFTAHADFLGLLRERVCFEGAYAGGGSPNMCVAFIASHVPRAALVGHLPMAQWVAPV